MNEKTLGERIKEQRTKHNQTQLGIARECFVDVKTERNWEKDTTTPSFENIDTLCSLFDCEPDYLFGRIDYPTHEVTDIQNKTGLSIEICEQLLSHVYLAPTIDWLLNNGFMDILYDLSSISDDVKLFKLHPLPSDMYYQSEEAFQKSTSLFWKAHEIDEESYLYDLFSSFADTDLRILKQWSLFDFKEPDYEHTKKIVSYEKFKDTPFIVDRKLSDEKKRLVYDLSIHAHNATFDYFALKHTFKTKSLDYMVKFKSIIDRYIEEIGEH